jgi:hypothetical protein
LFAGPTERAGEGGRTHRRGRRRRRFAELSLARGERWWLRPVRGRRCPGATFYRRPRGGERRSSVGAGINVTQRRRRDLTAGGGGYWQGRGQAAGTGRCRTSLCGEGMARGRRCIVREEDDAADRWGRSASERERARERGWLAREREGGECVSGCARGSGPAIGPKGGRTGARERGGGRGMGQIWPSRGGERAFSFSFYFL